jgi:cytochrome c
MRGLIIILLAISMSACSDEELVSMQQLSSGAKLYELHCSNCHQADGSGLAQLIPPLKRADYLSKAALNLPCIIKKGMQGSMVVNGVEYNQKMPAQTNLSDKDILHICLFVLQKFPEKPISVSEEALGQALQKCP